MLRKLIKYEFKSTYRTFLIVYAVMASLCVLTGALDRVNANGALEKLLPLWAILAFLTSLFFFATVIITTVLNVNRFYKGVFSDEGYLLHTLPVRPWQIITAKLIPAVVWTIATVIVMGASLMLMVFCSSVFLGVNWGGSFSEFFQALWELLQHLDLSDILDLLSVPLMLLIALVSTVLQVYASLSIGHLFSRRRLAWSVAVWFVLGAVESISTNLLSWLADSLGWNDSSLLEILFSHGIGPSFVMIMVYNLIWCALFWAITQWVLSRKLNLE